MQALPVSSLVLTRCISRADAVQASIMQYKKCCFGCMSRAGNASQEGKACLEPTACAPCERRQHVMHTARKLVCCLQYSSTGGINQKQCPCYAVHFG